MLISPTEPADLRALGKTSSIPERFGVDVMWAGKPPYKRCGAQRKEINDFLASVKDGRLAKERQQMQALDLAVLILEGPTPWADDGSLMNLHHNWTVAQHWKYLWSVQADGIWIHTTRSLEQTMQAVAALEAWSRSEHKSGKTRPGPEGEWGKPGSRDWQMHFLQGLPGLGPEMAERIVDHFDGVPVVLDVSREELLKIDGLGPKRVDTIIELLGGENG